jgi:outer membrane biosynthesis protein TonB
MKDATRTGAALAAAVVIAAAGTPWALADAGAPTDTTPTPTVTTPDPSATVTAPETTPAPVEVVPKPDPGPVKVVVSKPKPQVVHPVYRQPATPPVVVHPSVATVAPTVVKPRVTPKHIAARRKHLVKAKQRTPAPVQVTKPKPAAKELTTTTESAPTGGSWTSAAWTKIALGAGLALLLLSTVLVAIRRRSGRRTDAVPSSASGSSPALRDDELASLELELSAHAERADELAAELAPFRAGEDVIPESLLLAEKTANELRDSAEATLLKARRLADRIVEEAARRRTRLEARNAALKLEVKAQAERADELEAELAQFHAREQVAAPSTGLVEVLLDHTSGDNGSH